MIVSLIYGTVGQTSAAPPLFATTLQATLTGTGTTDLIRNFGAGVALSADGNTALIGASDSTVPNGVSFGLAFIYVRAGGAWTQQTILSDPDPGSDNRRFGSSVALSSDGNTALVGQYYDSVDGLLSNGAGYVYTRTGTTWTLQTKLLASDRVSFLGLGFSAALSSDGNTAVLGALSFNGLTARGSGSAYVFVRNGTTWTEQVKFVSPDSYDVDWFGGSVALGADGNTALIGSRGADEQEIDAGAAYVFTRSGTTWTQQARLLANEPKSFELAGYSVALSDAGNLAILGAPDADRFADNEGAVYTFTRSGTTWTQQSRLKASITPSTGTQIYNFGKSVSVDATADLALVGSNSQNGDRVFTYTRNGALWEQRVSLQPPTGFNSGTFGVATALDDSGNTALIGNSLVNSGIGAAHVFVDSGLPTPTVEPTSTVTPTPIPGRVDAIGKYFASGSLAGQWYLRYTNTRGPADITVTFGGDPSDLPIAGDWNGDGVDTIGIYRSSTGQFFLSPSNTAPSIQIVFTFGNPGDKPLRGRWTTSSVGDGVGVYRNSNGILYQKNTLDTGISDYFAIFGNPDDQGIAADWDNDGFDSIGVYRVSNTTWYLSNDSTPSGITFADVSFSWGLGSGNQAVAGDWEGDGITTVGFYRGVNDFTLHGALGTSGANLTVAITNAPLGGTGLVGRWGSPSAPSLTNISVPGNGSRITPIPEGDAD
jgi:hypothetical protein